MKVFILKHIVNIITIIFIIFIGGIIIFADGLNNVEFKVFLNKSLSDISCGEFFVCAFLICVLTK